MNKTNFEEIIEAANIRTKEIAKVLQNQIYNEGVTNICYKQVNFKVTELKDIMAVCDNSLNDSRLVGQIFSKKHLFELLSLNDDNMDFKEYPTHLRETILHIGRKEPKKTR